MSKGIGKVATQFHTFGSADDPFVTAGGVSLPVVTIAYETYGELNADRSNAVVLFHALSGSQHAAGSNHDVPGLDGRWTEELHTGWWDGFIGSGRALDTNKYFIICANYLGGCYGSTGPCSINPATGKVYAGHFPRVTVHDIVRSQLPVLEKYGIEMLHAVVGTSLGGMMALDFAVHWPDRVANVITIGTGIRSHGLQQMHNLEQIIAITRDPEFRGGDYYGTPGPVHGLALARMISHKTFLYADVIEERARVDIVRPESDLPWYDISSSLESYMLYQGQKFVRRFDANSYLRIIDAWQQFDLYKDAKHSGWQPLFGHCKDQQYLVFTIDSDCCFYPDYQTEICSELKKAGVPYLRLTVHSEKGHDSFLLEPKLYTPHLAYALSH
ncbi:MAG: homoserine O-acetyltransferase [Verrucomicrobia bacterium]|jgi:homoserine O-acetyltransferase/O-succinyltransferase|nr:homoserine O-acetyltransferase [Verrucomicrobiota bacterium]MDA1203806.1 homoserine O-acetyltransferase [Verrucomicrobiota bacterium]